MIFSCILLHRRKDHTLMSKATRTEDPSRRRRSHHDDDELVHFRIVRFMMESGIKLRMTSVPMATAAIIYHRFFSHCRLQDYDPYLIGMTAISLASKVEEEHLKIRDVINVCYRTRHQDKPPLESQTELSDLRQAMASCELLIMRTLGFNVTKELPHKYLLHYLKSLADWMDRSVWERTPIRDTAWAMLRDLYHGKVCLWHKAQHLAVAVLYFSLLCYGIEVPLNNQAETKWWKVFSEDITEEQIKNIIEQIMDVYDLEQRL
ncbi:PREDICTED: cyclin-related protein FAM58A-like isoform X2 [Branchiostoma belcheri]|uniref:Cyclin-Q n=1 Tax=Branchiostoma belcheri TaxID=7741 RepID=A0A6P4ZWF1_BRABE|nr:PREDICTED: cyclin-related protein FAM58A-like isoform X2 [Branchiostoma belcheri]